VVGLTTSGCCFFRVNELKKAEAVSLRTDLKIFLEEDEATRGVFAEGWEGASTTTSDGCFWLFRVNELKQAEAASPRTGFMLFFGFMMFSEGDNADKA
jgi:hypothetical protein